MSLVIGGINLTSPLVLAPMAGITDLPFRLIAKACGAGLVHTEMVSANGLVHGNGSTRGLLKTIPEERPVSVQLFGSDPEAMGEAASILRDYPFDLIDINMGCPVRKVVRKSAGAALLKNIELAERIVRAVVDRAGRPVTVKTRLAWDFSKPIESDFARMVEAAGASAIVVHGRTASQLFSGSVDRGAIRAVREAVSIPVIGNGDVTTPEAIRRMMDETGCNGVMIGRGAMGNPWIFSPAGGPFSHEERLGFLLEHVGLMERYLTEREALLQSKKHAAWYSRGIEGGAHLRKALHEAKSLDEIRDLARGFFL